MKKNYLIAAALLCGALFAGCYTPSPLYGTWADNSGNKITFLSDGSFVAKITDSNRADTKPIQYEGTYTVIDNVLVFSYQAKTMNTEWDIRGSLLHCTWTFENTHTKQMTLYQTAR